MILCYLQGESVTAAPFVGRHTVLSRPRERRKERCEITAALDGRMDSRTSRRMSARNR